MSVKDEFARKVEADELCAKVLKAVRENDEAELRRMGFGEFARYAERLADLMTVTVGEELDFSSDFAALMEQVASPIHYAYHLVTECGVGIQQAIDALNGIRMQPAQPKFIDSRLKGIVGEAAESETDKASQNFATQLGTFIKSAGNNFMKANAQQRAKAGFTVMIQRTGGANCCPWCAGLVGRWTIKNAPKDVFGCHDNCTCMVEYTNSRGVTSQSVGGAKFVDVEYEPTRLTDGAGRGAGEPKRLTGGANGGIISALSIDNFREADPEGKISEECFDTIIETLKAQKQLYGYNSVRVVDIPPDENNRYEVMRTNAIATPRYPVVILELNRRFFGGRSKAEIDEFIRLQHYSAANSLEEAVIHECGHLKVIGDKSYSEYEAIDKELKGRAFTAPIKGRKDGKSLRDIAAEISPYAQKDGLECIAESEVILSRGETLSEDLQKLYDKYVK